MAKCKFDIAISKEPAEIVQKAAEAIGHAGGALTGDSSAGEFQLPTPLGSIRGKYSLQQNVMQIEIGSKPMLLSCSRIEEELRNYLSA